MFCLFSGISTAKLVNSTVKQILYVEISTYLCVLAYYAPPYKITKQVITSNII